MTLHSRLLAFAALTLLPASIVHAVPIAATSFDGQTISGNTASNLNWTLNGVEDPGDIAALNASASPQNLFTANALVQDLFAPGLNTGNGNTFWTTTVALTVAAGSSVTLNDVTFDYWAVNGGQNQNVNRKSDFTITLRDPSSAILEAVTIADSLNGTGVSAGAGTPVTATFTSPIALTDPGTYTLEIKGGDFTGDNETGNHTAIDNLSINGPEAGDTSAPTPDPMTFAVPPAATGTSSITMTADTATDDSGVVYLFTNTTLTTESGWQDSPEWTDSGLAAATEYTYTVRARDKSPAQNETAASAPAAATTDATDVDPPTPDPMTFEVLPTAVDGSSITMTATTAADDSGVEYLFENLTLATNSGWQASPTWTETGLAPNMTYSYTVKARDTSPAQRETLSSAPASATLVEIIATTNFGGRTLPSANTASNLNWALNGIEDPGDMAAFNAPGNPQALFNGNALVQNMFAPGLNTGNGNTFWTTSVSLTVPAGSIVTLTDVTFDYWAINGGQVQNVNRNSDFTITLSDPSSAVFDAVTVEDILNGTGVSPGMGTPVTAMFASPIVLAVPGTYTLEIKGGDFTGVDETGNHTAIDNLSINGSTGVDAGPQITSFAAVGSDTFQLTLLGEPDTAYEFRSSTTLMFDPGLLVENLAAGVPAVGTIGGPNDSLLTTDENGDASVRLMLTGDPADFVRAQIPPPLLDQDFESDDGGFTIATSVGSDWQHGDPESSGLGGLVETGNAGSMNCWGTNIGNPGYFADTTETRLRSTVIDLTGVAAAELRFAQALDIQEGDTAVVNIIDDTDENPATNVIAAAVYTAADADGSSANWTSVGPIAIPTPALGQPVRIEWSFTGTDGITNEYMGWYIDDVTVQATTP